MNEYTLWAELLPKPLLYAKLTLDDEPGEDGPGGGGNNVAILDQAILDSAILA